MDSAYIEAGKIVSTHGIHGEVCIEPWCDSAEFLSRFKHLYISDKKYNVSKSRVHKRMCLTKLEDVDDINSAMRLKNLIVAIARDDADLPAGTYFLQDLLGLSVYDVNKGEIGVVAEILTPPGQNIFVVKGAHEHLIPDVKEFVISIDISARRITVKLIEGM